MANVKNRTRLNEDCIDKIQTFSSFVIAVQSYSTLIKPEQLTKEMMEDFADYLANGKGEGPGATLQCFKRVIHFSSQRRM